MAATAAACAELVMWGRLRIMAGRFSASGLDRLRAAAERHVADDNVPGLVALAATGDQRAPRPRRGPELRRGAADQDLRAAAQRAHGGLGPEFFRAQSWSFCQAVHADGSFGWDGGLGSSWLVDPARDLIVIAVTQRMFESPALPQVHRDIRAAAYAALG
jgi:CubicO group peptidase (beta-lactamase class C family)